MPSPRTSLPRRGREAQWPALGRPDAAEGVLAHIFCPLLLVSGGAMRQCAGRTPTPAAPELTPGRVDEGRGRRRHCRCLPARFAHAEGSIRILWSAEAMLAFSASQERRGLSWRVSAGATHALPLPIPLASLVGRDVLHRREPAWMMRIGARVPGMPVAARTRSAVAASIGHKCS